MILFCVHFKMSTQMSACIAKVQRLTFVTLTNLGRIEEIFIDAVSLYPHLHYLNVVGLKCTRRDSQRLPVVVHEGAAAARTSAACRASFTAIQCWMMTWLFDWLILSARL